MDTLTKAESGWLEHAAHNARFGWSALSGRGNTKRVALKLIERGLLRDAGLAAVVDGDGFLLVPERYRTGYALTDAGAAWVAAFYEAERLRCEALAAGGG